MFTTRPRVVCFDPADDAALAQAAAVKAAQEAALVEVKYSQQDINHLVAEERRRNSAQLQRVQQTAEQAANEKAALAAEKAELHQRLEALETEKLTATQRADRDAKQERERQNKETQTAKDEAKRLTAELDNERLDRGIHDAISKADPFNAGQLYKIVRQDAKLVEQLDENGQKRKVVMVAVDDLSDDGLTTFRTELPVEAALKKMKELSANANLWRSGAVGGAGASSAAAGTNGRQPLGVNDTYTYDQMKNMTPAQYAAERAKNPQRLGISRKKGRA
jgi:hypothetical protein